MTKTQDATKHLNDLIESLKDGRHGFAAAAEEAERGDLKSLFSEYAAQREKFASALQSFVARAGETPEDSGSVAGALHRGWMSVKSAVSTHDDLAILEECERGEDAAVKAYREALSKDLGPAKPVVAEQAAAVKAAHDKIRNLRDSLKMAAAR